ncbi:MaoC family dehydratase [Rubrobacter marinus]|uniref:MaoC family dehydratase n=1 Tax=Rubrobacter marinus TaxID=2653852 RepID=A0A6G8Q336_9ACTN|nr:MaoC family dehydratase [Rubrobacter marinus]
MVGASSEPVANLIERGAVRKFAEAIGDPNPLYVDEGAARASRYGGLIAPPTFPRTLEYGRIEGMDWPDAGMIHGEHAVSYTGHPLLVGEEILCYTKLEDYYEKESRGGLLGFIVMERFGESPRGERRFTMRDVAIVTPALRKTLGS